MFSAHQVCVSEGGRLLLKGVSLELHPGELLAVVGPNGAGKSTLLKVFCGDLSPHRGEVRLGGRPLAAWRALEQAKTRAVLPQESTLSFPFTAREVALMGRNPHVRGVESRKDHTIAAAALDAAHVAPLAERSYPTLSGGEKQRVQLARTLAQVWEVPETGERYLLLDEPTASLDLAHQHQTLGVATHFARQGAGVLAVLHDLNLAAQYADRMVLLHAGAVFAEGRPHEVLTERTISAAFETPVVVTPHPCLNCPLVVSAVGSARHHPAEEHPAEVGS